MLYSYMGQIRSSDIPQLGFVVGRTLIITILFLVNFDAISKALTIIFPILSNVNFRIKVPAETFYNNSYFFKTP